MSSVLERAKAHYQGLPRRDIQIPEWGEAGKPAIITWSKLTVNEQDRIYAPIGGTSPGGGTVRLRAVLIKACDENGKLLFDGMDEHSLRYEVDGDIVGRIANAILFGAGLVTDKGEGVPAGDQVDAAKKP